MGFKELMNMTQDELEQLSCELIMRDKMGALHDVSVVKQYGHKRVRVVKGRKVAKGTEGEVFWIGSFCHSPYGDPWGIYTVYRCGIKDDAGEVYWTSIDNVECI